MIDARVKTIIMGQMVYYQPQLKLGWWIFKRWCPIYANILSGLINLSYYRLYADYDKALQNFEDYRKLTNKNYRLIHSKPVDA